jgi:hypothetical protein
MNKLIMILGFCCGCMTVLAVILFNPTGPAPLAASGGAELYEVRALEFHGAELDAVRMLGLPLPTAKKPFLAAGIAGANASIVVLSDAEGAPVALATRLVAQDDAGEILEADLGVNTYINIFLPNHGSLLMYGYENRWPIVRDAILNVMGQAVAENWQVSSMRADGITTGVAGGSGAFERAGGRFSETLQPSPADNETFMSQLALEVSPK